MARSAWPSVAPRRPAQNIHGAEPDATVEARAARRVRARSTAGSAPAPTGQHAKSWTRSRRRSPSTDEAGSLAARARDVLNRSSDSPTGGTLAPFVVYSREERRGADHMLVLNFLEHFPQLGAQTWRFHTEPRPIDRKLVDIKEWKKTITAFIVTLIFTNLVVKGITGQSIIIVPPERWAKTQTIENGSVVVENHPILRQVRFLADPTGGFHFGIGVRFESYVFIPVESDQDAPCVFFRDRPPPVSAK